MVMVNICAGNIYVLLVHQYRIDEFTVQSSLLRNHVCSEIYEIRPITGLTHNAAIFECKAVPQEFKSISFF
jgi:hypothetical protein